MTMKSERVFLIVLLIMMVVLLSGCALLDKLRGGVSPHTDYLIEVPVVEDIEDVRG